MTGSTTYGWATLWIVEEQRALAARLVANAIAKMIVCLLAACHPTQSEY